MHNIHMLYKVSSGHFQTSERHKAKGIHRNIIQRSNVGMPAMTNVHLSVDKSLYKSCTTLSSQLGTFLWKSSLLILSYSKD